MNNIGEVHNYVHCFFGCTLANCSNFPCILDNENLEIPSLLRKFPTVICDHRLIFRNGAAHSSDIFRASGGIYWCHLAIFKDMTVYEWSNKQRFEIQFHNTGSRDQNLIFYHPLWRLVCHSQATIWSKHLCVV